MPKFTVDIQEIIHYQMEVEADSAEEAASIAEDKFFDASRDQRSRNWEYTSHQEFEEPEEVVDEPA
jgi:hypothetical protein